MASLLFTVETDLASGFGFGYEFELSSHDLPRDLQIATKLRKTVTHYAGTYTSVQVHGTEMSPMEIEGTFDDSWWGEQGRTKNMIDQIERVAQLGEIVRMEFEGLQLWGTIDFGYTYKTEARAEYRLTFEPFWREDPRQKVYISFAQPPNDLAELLDARLKDTSDFLEDAPFGVDLSFVADIVLAMASARNAVSNVLGLLSSVADYADLIDRQAGLVRRSLFATVKTVTSVRNRLAAAGENIVQADAGSWLRGGEYVYEGTRRVDTSLEDLVAMLRKFLEVSRPKRQVTHVVRAGDTLQRLAEQYLGDFSRWTEIADANDLEGTAIVVGSVLIIPRR